MNQSILKAKENTVSEIKDLASSSSAVVFCDYRGLSVKDISELRKSLREKGAKANVYKNTLVDRALAEVDGVKDYLNGPNLFVFCKDATDGSLKELTKFAKKHEVFSIKGGVVDGKIADGKYIKTLANLPSKEGLVSMLLSVLQAPMRNLAYSISQVASKKE